MYFFLSFHIAFFSPVLLITSIFGYLKSSYKEKFSNADKKTVLPLNQTGFVVQGRLKRHLHSFILKFFDLKKFEFELVSALTLNLWIFKIYWYQWCLYQLTTQFRFKIISVNKNGISIEDYFQKKTLAITSSSNYDQF